MNNEICSLDCLEIGQKCLVTDLHATSTQRRRMLDLGLVPGTYVQALHKSPSGDPVAYYIRGSVIALRLEDAKKVCIKLLY